MVISLSKSWVLSILSTALVVLLALPVPALPEVHDPFDPFDFRRNITVDEDADKDKSIPELLLEAEYLLQDDRPLDARTKLLRVLQRDPTEYNAHILLAGYYIIHVNHFRLALKHVKQAQSLFTEKNGPPPYYDVFQQAEHGRLLYLLSQARLSLDNYQGALDTLDEYSSYGYSAGWYTGTRAWTLMKLGRLDEALAESKRGMLSGAETGRNLNMLGILLSMTGDKPTSLKVFREAINYEKSLGFMGQPATPLNNSGEVYREMFEDEQAEASWLQATRLPDGCQHVLPSLNLVLLYLEQLNLSAATQAVDRFESCVAQYPLKNGEEHRALVHLARGRIDLHAGYIDSAINHLELALERRQWFGKIGTKEEDLRVGVFISLAQALKRKNNHEKLYIHESWRDRVVSLKERLKRTVRSWWLMRKARLLLVDDLNELTDIHVRNTDSMIEYSTFGEALASFPSQLLKRRIDKERESDERREAQAYYTAYLAENYLNSWNKNRGYRLLDETIPLFRSRFDNGLRAHSLLTRLAAFKPGSPEYTLIAREVFGISRSALRNYGYRLPVALSVERPGDLKQATGLSVSQLGNKLGKSAFFISNESNLQYKISYSREDDLNFLSFTSSTGNPGEIKVSSNDLREAINKLSDVVFTRQLN